MTKEQEIKTPESEQAHTSIALYISSAIFLIGSKSLRHLARLFAAKKEATVLVKML